MTVSLRLYVTKSNRLPLAEGGYFFVLKNIAMIVRTTIIIS